MEPSNRQIQEIKIALEQQHIREFSWEEATKAARDIHIFANIILNMAMEDVQRLEKLKENPKGFHLEGNGYTCQVCGSSASNENSWFDRYGVKCMICQMAINNKIIPGSLVKNKNNWYTKYELEKFFNLKGKLLNKCLKHGFLKDRKITDEGKSIHLQLFLIKDNNGILPPKNLLNSRIIKVVKDGKEYFTSEYLYEFVDEKLAKYKISALFPETFSQPIKNGHFYFEKVNPLFSF